MAIELDEPRRAGSPVVKKNRIGETFRGAIIKYEQRPIKKDGEVVMNERTGKPKQEMVVHCMALAGTTAFAGIGDENGVPAPGTVVRLILRGGAFSAWIDARKDHRGGKLVVGDIITQSTEYAQAYDAYGQPKGGRIIDQASVDALPRSVTTGFYGPLTLAENDSPELVAQTEAEYHKLNVQGIDLHDEPVGVDEQPF